MAKVTLKIYRYRYRHRGKSLFTYRLLTELKIPLPYISGWKTNALTLAGQIGSPDPRVNRVKLSPIDQQFQCSMPAAFFTASHLSYTFSEHDELFFVWDPPPCATL